MLSLISFRQLKEWMVYADLEPFDEVRADIRTAHIISTLANVNRDPKKRRKAFDIADCLLHFGDSRPPKKVKSARDMENVAKMIALSYGVVPRKESNDGG